MPEPESVLAPELPPNAVTVSIYDQVYTLRGQDREWIERLAELGQRPFVAAGPGRG